jgi:hypothetical protein
MNLRQTQQPVFDYTPGQRQDYSQVTTSPPQNITRVFRGSESEMKTGEKGIPTESSLTEYTPASDLQFPKNQILSPVQ